jgi:hypothetical protein
MGKTLFGISVADLGRGFRRRMGNPTEQSPYAGTTGQVDTFKMMTTGKQMPSEHFADYSFVFN